VFTAKSDRPYFETWLRRTRRQLSVSGRLSEIALLLSREEGGSADSWRNRLRDLLEGEEAPSVDLLIQIDQLLAGKSQETPSNLAQDSLF
jgi:hypothetical protein